jgi:hypothetical protein
MKGTFDIIAREIDEIERKWRAVMREASDDVMLPVRWSYFGAALRWHVLLGNDVFESDVDVEVTSTVLIVRARSAREESKILLGLLPVPSIFDVCEPEIHFEAGALEIILRRPGGDDC